MSQNLAVLQNERYDGFAITLHWLTAALVVTLFALAQIWGFLPHASDTRHLMQSLHVSLGITLSFVLFVRLAWRGTFGHRWPTAGAGLMEWAARALHYVLYGLLLTMVVTGFGKIWSRNHSAGFFGLISLRAPFAVGKAWQPVVDTVHQWCAWTIIVLVGLHALAALFHHYVLRDGILQRMLPRRRISG
jgi:cytochrome b561